MYTNKPAPTGLEGIISKRIDAPYVAGRQKTWLKVKCSLRQEFIIIGYSTRRAVDARSELCILGTRKTEPCVTPERWARASR